MYPSTARGVELTRPPLFELRVDPISGRKVYIAEGRTERPNDFEAVESIGPVDVNDCPFCAGHEQQTPEPLEEIRDRAQQWQVRVIPNKYPAVCLGAKVTRPHEQEALLFESHSPEGAHEVIIESPNHAKDIVELSVEALALVLQVYRGRLLAWEDDPRMRQGMIFKNVGFAAGASLEHLHSQLVVLPFVPVVLEEELQRARQFYETEKCCVFCRLLDVEHRRRIRLVAEEGPFVAFCAFAGRQPFETWIVPSEHSCSYQSLSDADALALATILRRVVSCLQTQLSPLSYNLLLHTSPFGDAHAASFHWHIEIVPRSTHLAGLEWGTGVAINPLSPERAADLLREAKI